MAQQYLWRVDYEAYANPHHYFKYRTYLDFVRWEPGCKVFSNKINAMNFAAKISNSPVYRNVRIYKWKG